MALCRHVCMQRIFMLSTWKQLKRFEGSFCRGYTPKRMPQGSEEFPEPNICLGRRLSHVKVCTFTASTHVFPDSELGFRASAFSVADP